MKMVDLKVLDGLSKGEDKLVEKVPSKPSAFRFKKRSRKGRVRKRTGSTRKDQLKHAKALQGIDDAEGSDGDAGDDKVSHYSKRKRRRKGLIFAAMETRAKNGVSVSVKSNRSSKPLRKDQGATVEMQKKELEHEITQGKVLNAEGQEIYKGEDYYHDMSGTSTKKVRANSGSKGPQKPQVNVLPSCRFDYEPSVCKDYKETGYCGYGDSCKFLHDRGDYKMGWQLEAEWQQKQARIAARKRGEIVSDSDSDYEIKDSEDDEVPFACHICRDSFTKPMRTKCNHFFCQKCIVDHYLKIPTCPVCGRVLDGSFVRAEKILLRLSRRVERRHDDAAGEND